MGTETEESINTYRSKIDTSGRILIPAGVRDRLHLQPGDELIMVQVGDSCRLETPEQALREAQAYFKGLVGPGVSVVDELLAERRAEALRE